LKISPFNEPYPARPHSHRFLTPASLPELVARMAEKHKGGLLIELDGTDPSGAKPGSFCADHAVCEIGTRSLHVMPDGSVSRCRYLPGVPEMIVGSLEESALLEIWNGIRLNSMTRPSRESYAGTSCFGCGSHEACNSRGRCYASALMNQGRLHAPDSFCSEPAR
jgi:radical SAM protein with 4Fe4S-binding SPASM domain